MRDDVPTELSPAERYAAAAQRAAFPALTEFAATKPFRLDPFQTQACQALERGENVLVCAPTGAGKTVVAEFAVAMALGAGRKCFYTTPIKALSNQKFADLVRQYGAAAVGLLTGDTTTNPHAPIIVMTTEVLRNMLYVGSDSVDELAAVVLDEVHYLADRFRGAVWEEVILHLPTHVRVVGLSATVSNAEEFGDWIRAVRGPTTVVVDEIRPVPLWQHMLVGSRLYDLYAHEVPAHADDADADGPGGRRRIDPDLQRAIARVAASLSPRSAHGVRRERGRYLGASPWRPTARPVVIDRLDRAGLLPAIVFVFSRAGCDAAVEQCVRSGLFLADDDEQAEIRQIISHHVQGLSTVDLEALGFHRLRAAWERGIAAHHAGLLPAFKEAVEELFLRGLVKVVFATETLALGINMPARTVVLERLVKFDGESHADITAGEYTQLTGRAGRRGIDVEGHAVVLFSPDVDPNRLAGLAATRAFPLFSSFRPTYNMVANLVDRLGWASALALLERSFAQFQADRTVVGRARQVDESRRRLAAWRAEVHCSRGDIEEYADLVRELAAAEKAMARSRAAERRTAAAADFAMLRRGDVIRIDRGRRAGLAVVIDARPGAAGDVRPLVINDQRWAGRVTRADFRGGVPVLGRLQLGKHVDHANAKVRADISAALGARGIGSAIPRGSRRPQSGDAATADALRAAVLTHPVHGCPDAAEHIAAARRISQLSAQTVAMAEQVRTVRGSMSRAMERIGALLAERGYLLGEKATGKGHLLQRIWFESDLLAAECLAAGTFRELNAPILAGTISALVFEGRRGMRTPAGSLSGGLRAAAFLVEEQWQDLATIEAHHGLQPTRQPDFGFAEAVAGWVSGRSLADCLLVAGSDGLEQPAGDFVRWCRQVVDALDQLRRAADPADVPAAGAAIAAISRGVVTLGAR